MGKKTKAKSRKDRFYHLAKETGYRARSAFKLIQLNKRFSFLQTSRVVIDLCAAPGGWLQVASQHMAVSSLIVGVDLVPIRPIPKCVTLQDDITTDGCRSKLRKELHDWKADCVLHDGSPNVGKNWLHDAFSQAVLTLHALHLACDFLRKGGWFITKVFRSKDYQPLMWIFNQLFKKVHATKPQASRNESAEIFVVCQGFKAPDKIDKKFFDPKCAFQEVIEEVKNASIRDFDASKKKKKKAVGYEDDAVVLFKSVKVTEYLSSKTPLKMLANINQIIFDNSWVRDHAFTTDDIRESMKDIKVLGKTEIKRLVTWQLKIIRVLEKEQKNLKKDGENDDDDADDENSGDETDEEIEKKLEQLRADEAKVLKRKKKLVVRERRKLRERMGQMSQTLNEQEDMELFALTKIQSKEELGNLDADMAMEEVDAEILRREILAEEKNKYGRLGESRDYYLSSSEEEVEEQMEQEEEKPSAATNPLIVPLVEDVERAREDANMWFSKDAFAGIKEESNTTKVDMKQVKQVEQLKKKMEANKLDEDDNEIALGRKPEKPGDSSSSESEYDMEAVCFNRPQPVKTTISKANDAGFEVVPSNDIPDKLSAQDLAMGTVISTSRKRKRDLVDLSYNRYTFNDEDLPEWFVRDEQRRVNRDHYLKEFEPKELVQSYTKREMKINSRTIKKVVEAKARKRQRFLKKADKVRQKSEKITNEEGSSAKEKASQIKSMYKKAGLLNPKKENTTYVFARKGTGRRVRRPPGVTGKFKVVDKRMKSDLRGKNPRGGNTGGGKGKKRR